MKRFSFASLRVRLILLVLVAIIPALGITIYSDLKQRNQSRLHAWEDAQRRAQEFAEGLDHLIQNARQILFTLSKTPQVQQQDKAACNRIFAEIVKQSEGYTALVAAKPNGDVFASTIPITRPVNFADRPWFQRVLKTHDFVIGEYLIGRVSGKPSIILAYPDLDDTGNLKAVLALGMDLEWLKQTIAKSELIEGTSVSVLDRNGTILFRFPEPEKFMGKSMPEESIVKAILTKRKGVEETVGLGGVTRLFGFASLGKGVESVSVVIPKKIVFAKIDQVLIQNLIFLGIMAVLGLLGAWFVGNFFVFRPVERLLNTTKRLADGDLNARVGPPYGRGEVSELAHAFDQMAESFLRRVTERKRAEEEARRLAEEKEVMAEIGRIISSTLNIEEVYEQFAKEVYKLIEFDRLTIKTIRDEVTGINAYEGGIKLPGRRLEDTFPLAGTNSEEVMRTRKSLLLQIGDSMELGRFPGSMNIYPPEFQSLVAVPLISQDRVIGVLHFLSCTSNAYTENDAKLAQRVGDQIAGAIANAQIFLELKRAEEGLRESEKRYRLIADNAQDVIWTADGNLRINYVSPSVTRMRGYTVEEVLSQSPDELFTPESRQLMMKVLAEEFAIEKREEKDLYRSRTLEIEVKCKDGSTYWAETKLSFLRDVDGQWIGILGVGRDISERKRAEEALQVSERKFQAIFDTATDGILLADTKNNKFFSGNKAICEMLGYTLDEILKLGVYDIHPEEELPRVMDAFTKQAKKEIALAAELPVRRKDGSVFYADISSSPAMFGGQEYLVGIFRDITERKRAEEEKATLQEQLRQSQKMEAIGQLAGGIAHDFNNLLTVMKGHSQLALMDLKEGDQFRETFQTIEEATTKAANLVRQILAFSRRQVMEMVVLDLNTLLRNLEKMLRRIIGEDIGLLTVLADDLGRVKADPGQIEQVVFNLATNARDAVPQGGKLTIETANVELDEAYAHRHVAVIPGRYVMIAVSDTGVGMTPEVKERVFEPFFTTKERGKGTGLGLATVYGIVKQSGGNIWVYSEPGQGTTFKIYLPRVDEPLAEEREKEESGLFLGVGVILVVEDEEGVRKLVLDMLEKQGYSVLGADDEEEALLICQQYKETIHLLVTDVVMPKISGPELAKRLVVFQPEMKVLYMSGYADNAIVHHGVLEEGVNFIQKPFTMEGLAKKVREVLDKDSKPAV